LQLGAANGATVVVLAKGSDAEDAVDALVDVLQNRMRLCEGGPMDTMRPAKDHHA
jgi:hypothetical protein